MTSQDIAIVVITVAFLCYMGFLVWLIAKG